MELCHDRVFRNRDKIRVTDHLSGVLSIEPEILYPTDFQTGYHRIWSRSRQTQRVFLCKVRTSAWWWMFVSILTTSSSIHTQSESWSMRRLSLNALWWNPSWSPESQLPMDLKAVQKAERTIRVQKTGTPFLGVCSINLALKLPVWFVWWIWILQGNMGEKVKN